MMLNTKHVKVKNNSVALKIANYFYNKSDLIIIISVGLHTNLYTAL